MADTGLNVVTDDNPSPGQDDLATGNGAAENRGTKRPRMSTAGDDDDDDDDTKGRERRKIEIKFIQDKSRRHITFSKRKAGIMKKVSDALFTSDRVAFAVAFDQFINADYGYHLGVRAFGSHGHPGASPRRFGNWSRLHLHNPKAPASGHQG